MAVVPEHDEGQETPTAVARPVVRIDLDVPDGVELRLTVNGVDVELDD
jgi:hypothetical protein